MKRPKGLYAEHWPAILETDVADALKIALSSMLTKEPNERESFTGMLKILQENEEAVKAMPLTEVKRE